MSWITRSSKVVAAVAGHPLHEQDRAGRRDRLGRNGRGFLRQRSRRTIIGLYKAELICRRGQWRTAKSVQAAAARWVSWFNTRRLLGSLGWIPPAEYEHRWAEGQTP